MLPIRVVFRGHPFIVRTHPTFRPLGAQEAIHMAMSKKDKTKKEQQLKKEAAELKARADAGDKEAKRELEKVNKKLKK